MNEKIARNKSDNYRINAFKDIMFFKNSLLNFLGHNFELSVNCNEYD